MGVLGDFLTQPPGSGEESWDLHPLPQRDRHPRENQRGVGLLEAVPTAGWQAAGRRNPDFILAGSDCFSSCRQFISWEIHTSLCGRGLRSEWRACAAGRRTGLGCPGLRPSAVPSPAGQGLRSVSLSRATDRRVPGRLCAPAAAPSTPVGPGSHVRPLRAGRPRPALQRPAVSCGHGVGGCGALPWGAPRAPCVVRALTAEAASVLPKCPASGPGSSKLRECPCHTSKATGGRAHGEWGPLGGLGPELAFAGGPSGQGTAELRDCRGRASPLGT